MKLKPLAAGQRGTKRWRGRLAALAFGVIAAGALPPLYWFFLLPIAYGGLLWLLQRRNRAWAAWGTGWWFGLGHFAAGFYWVTESFLVEPEVYGWMIPFALGGLAGGLAIFPALATLLAWRLARGLPGRAVVLAVAWAGLEWVRGHIFTGLPFNLMGSTWAFDATPLQAAEVIGAYGLSALTAPFAFWPLLFGRGWRGTALALMGIGSAAALWTYGFWRLGTAPAPGREVVAGLSLTIIQPNIAQTDKWQPDLRDVNLLKQLRQSLPTGGETGRRVVIWPETAATFFLEEDGPRRALMAQVLGPDDVLLTGAPRRSAPGAVPFEVWNSLFALDAGGAIRARFDKFHLVPFGEYVPLPDWVPVKKLTAGRTDFSPGPGPQTLRLPGIPPFSPLICYEAIFPGAVTDAQDPPAWLLNITNDAWFGSSAGPYQHLAAARLRAVEEGLPLIRAANTGISAVYDAYGRQIALLELGQEGVITSPLPDRLSYPTIYSRWKDAGFWFILALMMGIWLTIERGRGSVGVENTPAGTNSN